MVSTARFINFENIKEAFPAFVTMAIMPFTFSISNGLLAGLAATFALWVLDIGRELLASLVHRADPGRKTPGEVLHRHTNSLPNSCLVYLLVSDT
jgi:xanthine/uracil/vitamin C permease (AzgA family)